METLIDYITRDKNVDPEFKKILANDASELIRESLQITTNLREVLSDKDTTEAFYITEALAAIEYRLNKLSDKVF